MSINSDDLMKMDELLESCVGEEKPPTHILMTQSVYDNFKRFTKDLGIKLEREDPSFYVDGILIEWFEENVDLFERYRKLKANGFNPKVIA